MSEPELFDPVIRIMPRAWNGEAMLGRRFSGAPPRLLGQLFHLYEWSAQHNEAAGKLRFAEADRCLAYFAAAWRARLEAQAEVQP